MNAKKTYLAFASAALLSGAVLNIINALDDYGLSTNNLHSEM